MKLPDAYTTKMQHLLGKEYDEFINTYDKNKWQGLRVNTLKISVEDFLEICPFELVPIPWCGEGFYFEESVRPAKHPFYHAGLYYIQEPSAMAPVSILNPIPGEKILDICAAPGGKTVQIAAALKGLGVIVTNDINMNRVKALIKNIELYGIKNAIATNETPEKLSQYLSHYFDRILVDAPCSGEGMFRKDPSLIKSWESYNDDYYPLIQKNIMGQIPKMLKEGGKVLYSTCTFSPSENEGAIMEFLEQNSDFKLVNFPKKYGFSEGHPEWVNGDDELKACARLWPHKLAGEGHFMALLENSTEKSFEGPNIDKYNSQIREEFKSFVNENLNVNLDGVFNVYNEQLYLLPVPLPSLKGLKVMRSGWMLGSYKTKRFEPSQALAMGLKMNDVKRSINFKIDDQNAIRYLKGETLNIEGEKGWTLICIGDYPLGWAKQTGTGMKNYYPASWRWLD